VSAPPEVRKWYTQIGKLGAEVSWGNTVDRAARTAPGRAAMDAKFLAEADGDPVRAEHLRKAHFRRLALKSAQVRRAKAVRRRTDGGGDRAA
jgi:hypothetical protein